MLGIQTKDYPHSAGKYNMFKAGATNSKVQKPYEFKTLNDAMNNFFNSIRIEFNRLNWEHEFKLDSPSHHIVEIHFKHSKIVFTLIEKYNSVECQIINFKNQNQYTIKEVMQSLGLNVDNLYYEYSNVPPSKFISQYIEILYMDLRKVLEGDFSSTSQIDQIKLNTQVIQKTLKTPFVFEHPAYIKMINGDPTWKKALDE